MFETRFLPLSHLCEVSENCFIRLGHDWNNFYVKIDHSQQLRAYKLSTFFKSEAFTFPSDSACSVEFISLGPETLKGFRSPFAHRISLTNDFFFGFLCSCVPFFYLLLFRFSIMCRVVFNKAFILLELRRNEMIITNSALRTSWVIRFTSRAPSYNNCLIFIWLID